MIHRAREKASGRHIGRTRRIFVATPIYAYESLKPGNRLEGPAILEGEYTTVVVPPAMNFSIDERGLGILES